MFTQSSLLESNPYLTSAQFATAPRRDSSMRLTKSPRVAMFDDLENLHATAFDLIHGQGSYHDWPGPHEHILDLGAIKALVERKVGALCMHRAFAPFSPRYRCYFADMAKHLVSPVFVPTSNGIKNSADILLACQALKLALTDPTITHFVIASCDADFSNLAKELREMGKCVIGLGIAGAKINTLWLNSCDMFLHLPIGDGKKPPGNGVPQGPAPAVGKPREAAAGAVKPPGGDQPRQTPAPTVSLPPKLDDQVAAYTQTLERHQLRIPPRCFQSVAFKAIAEHFAGYADRLEDRDLTCKGLEGLLELCLAAAGRPGNQREVADLRLLLYNCGVVLHQDRRWRLLVEPTPEAIDLQLARTALKHIIRKHGEPNLAAVRQLLYGAVNAPEGALLSNLLADLLKALPCPVAPKQG
jgi:hypothetical protein